MYSLEEVRVGGRGTTSKVDLRQEENEARRCGDSASSSEDPWDMSVLKGEG